MVYDGHMTTTSTIRVPDKLYRNAPDGTRVQFTDGQQIVRLRTQHQVPVQR